MQDEDNHSVRIDPIAADRQLFHDIRHSNDHDEMHHSLEELQIPGSGTDEDHAFTMTTQVVIDSDDRVPVQQGNSTVDVEANLITTGSSELSPLTKSLQNRRIISKPDTGNSSQ